MTRKRKFAIYGSVCLAVGLLAAYFVFVVLRFDGTDIRIHPDNLVEIDGQKLDPTDQANDAKIRDYLQRKTQRDSEVKWYEPWLDKIGIHKNNADKNTVRIKILDPTATKWKCVQPIINRCAYANLNGIYINDCFIGPAIIGGVLWRNSVPPPKQPFNPIAITNESKFDLINKELAKFAEINPGRDILMHFGSETKMNLVLKTIGTIKGYNLKPVFLPGLSLQRNFLWHDAASQLIQLDAKSA